MKIDSEEAEWTKIPVDWTTFEVDWTASADAEFELAGTRSPNKTTKGLPSLPFGMQMPGRNGGTGDYRYAFNGMEHDPEVSGDGNSYTTEFRSYDPRLGRWKSLDPLMSKFPWQSPYVAFDNNPIFFNDPLGLAATGGGDGKKVTTQGSVAGYLQDEAITATQGDKLTVYGSPIASANIGPYQGGSITYSEVATVVWHAGNKYVDAGWYSPDDYEYAILDYGNGQVFPPLSNWAKFPAYMVDNREYDGMQVDDAGYVMAPNPNNLNPDGTFRPAADLSVLIGGGMGRAAAAGGAMMGMRMVKGIVLARAYQHAAQYIDNLKYTVRYLKTLNGRSADDVSTYLVNNGWTRSAPQAGFPAKTQHTIFTRVSRNGNTTTILDYHRFSRIC
jgi:RHS repeat-associated protein